MKKITSLFYMLLAFFAVTSCSPDEAPYYNGESLLHFTNPGPENAYVKLNTGAADYRIQYGVAFPVSGDHTVELVFVPEESTAVLGTDFTIVDGIGTLSNGAVVDDFVINIKEDAAEAGKTAVFTLKNSTLPTAVFNQKLTINFGLSCPVDNLPLVYDATAYAFNTYYDDFVATFTRVAGTDNKFNVDTFWGPTFVAAATGNAGYVNQYLYPSVLTINCESVVVEPNGAAYTGGSGTYDPTTGIIQVAIKQGLFTTDFTVISTFYPR